MVVTLLGAWMSYPADPCEERLQRYEGQRGWGDREEQDRRPDDGRRLFRRRVIETPSSATRLLTPSTPTASPWQPEGVGMLERDRIFCCGNTRFSPALGEPWAGTQWAPDECGEMLNSDCAPLDPVEWLPV